MKFTSQIVAAASGSVGGCTYSRNRYGAYIRNRSVPVNTQTAEQQEVRNNLATLGAAWVNDLAGSDRDGWNSYAAQVPRIDPLGNPIFVTGLNWYIAMNSVRMQAGKARIDTAPTIFTLATLTTPVPTASASTSSIAFTNSDTWAGAVGGGLAVFVSRPFSQSRSFFKGPYRFAGVINGAASPPTSPQVVTNPFLLATDQKAGYKFVAFNADARISSVLRGTDIL